jgi:hypothetical protein
MGWGTRYCPNPDRLPADPASVEAMIEQLQRGFDPDRLPADPASVEAMIEQLWRNRLTRHTTLATADLSASDA